MAIAPVKKSVRLTEAAINACRVISSSTSLGLDRINWSGSLNALAAEYVLLMEENKPKLTENQWHAFYCAFNGHMPHSDPKTEARLLSWRISEGYQYDGQIAEDLGSKEDAIAFIEEIQNWSLTTQLSVIYHARKFWTPMLNKKPNTEDGDKE